jgi:hypothetical protein
MKGRVLAAALLLASGVATAQKQTVCTVTVNSPDERDVFREFLPAERFDFVELVEHGRPDWLAASCRKGIRCDVLLVSGHFAGTEFYSSRFDRSETLPVDEIERVQCSDSCPGLFSQLKEVYLFGCDTLNPTPVRTATPEVAASLMREGVPRDEAARAAAALAERHGESALEHMRRLFPGVPVIYGFSSKAPYGRVAGPMLQRLFRAGGEEIGSGRVSERLRSLFAPASMMVTQGLTGEEPNADYRAEACRYHDERLDPAAKLAAIRATMTRSMAETRLVLDRIEKFFAALTPEARAGKAFAAELSSLAADAPLRARYVNLARDTPDPAVRLRLIALGGEIGWLDAAERRAEQVRMVADVLAAGSAGYGEVDLICALNSDRGLDGERPRLANFPLRAGRAADAALACLGDAESRARTLRAIASRDEGEVQIAQAYLRHRPITDTAELRAVARDVSRMEEPVAQSRALGALARLRIDDGAVLGELVRLFTRTRSLAVQRAIAEVFVRSGYRGEGDLARVLREYRLRSPDGADLIDTLIARLQS